MFTLNCKGRLLVVDKPQVMGIINCTPDSFYEGSRFLQKEEALREAEKMLTEGATLLDIGAQSTRPGSTRIGAEEELKRVIDIIESIHTHFPEAILSIDTYFSRVAYEAVRAGASIINDISAGSMDEAMLTIAANLNTPYICMHMKGEPTSMQKDPQYDDITKEVLEFFIHKLEQCKQAGIEDIIIDPGFGFGKTIQHNFRLLKELAAFSILKKPLLLGLSRKSTVYRTLGITAEDALNGTTVLNTIGLINGASILRVHDVKEAMESIKLFEAYRIA
jgi:dihydropteroate synthase